MNSISNLKQFSTVVEKIYDAAIDGNVWPEALICITKMIGADVGGIHFGDTSVNSVNMGSAHIIGISETFAGRLAQNAHIWALQSGLPFWNVGDVRHLPDILPHDEFINGRFYKEVLAPEKQDDYIGMLAVKDGTRIVPLTLATEVGSPKFQPQALELMRLLSPHICKSAKISFALELQSLKISQLESTLDSMSAGIYLIARDGRIMFMNQVAEQQVKRKRGLVIENNHLAPKDEGAAAQFKQSLSAENEVGTMPVSIALPDEHGGLLATILHLDKGQRQNLGTGSIFAVFVQDPEVAPPIPGEGFAKLYDLSQAEHRTLLAMAPGLGPQDAADILGLLVSTVKTHLQNIFHKTGTNKQGDLLQLLMRASAPLAAQ